MLEWHNIQNKFREYPSPISKAERCTARTHARTHTHTT